VGFDWQLDLLDSLIQLVTTLTDYCYTHTSVLRHGLIIFLVTASNGVHSPSYGFQTVPFASAMPTLDWFTNPQQRFADRLTLAYNFSAQIMLYLVTTVVYLRLLWLLPSTMFIYHNIQRN
jgi:hypothetical protein